MMAGRLRSLGVRGQEQTETLFCYICESWTSAEVMQVKDCVRPFQGDRMLKQRERLLLRAGRAKRAAHHTARPLESTEGA